VSPIELPGTPPNRDIEFVIELIHGTTSIYRRPYRMSDKKLAELKEQIQKLQGKGYIRLSSSPWGAPVIFVPKKDGTQRMCVTIVPSMKSLLRTSTLYHRSVISSTNSELHVCSLRTISDLATISSRLEQVTYPRPLL
jgi:hypothetical protein